VRLLADLRQVFRAADAEALYTSTILEALHRLEDAPWADWYGHPLATRELARLLRPYQVESKNIREHGTGAPRKGYVRADLQDAWARYVPLHPLHPLQEPEPAGQPGNGHVAEVLLPSATSATGPGDVADERIPSATGLTWDVAHVADVAAPPASNGNGWRYDQPTELCAVCGTGTTNRAPSGRPLHLACAARTTTEGPTMAEICGHRTFARLSRYPSRTAPTDPGHAHTRIRPAPGRSGPLTTAQRQD
jgi:hypothetical protein